MSWWHRLKSYFACRNCAKYEAEAGKYRILFRQAQAEANAAQSVLVYDIEVWFNDAIKYLETTAGKKQEHWEVYADLQYKITQWYDVKQYIMARLNEKVHKQVPHMEVHHILSQRSFRN